jgi:hypothetical protein
MNNVLVLLFSAGGAAFVTAVIAGVKNLRTTKIESEEILIARLNSALKQAERDGDTQRRRAERAERYAEQLRAERDDALNLAARKHRQLLEAGLVSPDEPEGNAPRS